jgi:SAM dependent carboxyl methyltransferase
MSLQAPLDNKPSSRTTAMEGGGFYNRNSAMQAAGISLLLDDWERIVRETVVDDGPIVIADYGSSQGRNSMPPIRIAIDELRQRVGRNKLIQIVHTDLPSNDFAALFNLLNDDPTSYMMGNSNVFPSAIGRSYFNPILPKSSVNLGWNTWTIHWMSNAVLAPDHIFAGLSDDAKVLQQVADRQAEDWRTFLKCRASELKPGAFLLSASVGRASDGTGWNWIGDHFWGAAEELGSEGLLSDDELLRLTIPVNGRTIAQIREPFENSDYFEGLHLIKADMFTVPDATWAAFQGNNDAKQLGTTHANMVRGFSGAVIANILSNKTDKDVIVDQLYVRLAERLAASPQIHEGRLAVVVLQKM